MRMAALGVLIIVSAFYAYGAAVHVANMLSLTGFDWMRAPLKWRLLDIAYLALDIAVAWGLWRRWPVSVAAFFIAAGSQILLYTLGRDWVLDVPVEFTPPPESVAYLDGLVVFHLVSVFAVAAALLLLGRKESSG